MVKLKIWSTQWSDYIQSKAKASISKETKSKDGSSRTKMTDEGILISAGDVLEAAEAAKRED